MSMCFLYGSECLVLLFGFVDTGKPSGMRLGFLGWHFVGLILFFRFFLFLRWCNLEGQVMVVEL